MSTHIDCDNISDMNNEIPQAPRIVNFTDETLNQTSTPIVTHQKTSTYSSGFLFAFTAFTAALVAYIFYGPLIYLLITETRLYFLQNIDLTPYIGLIAIVVSVFGVIVLIKNIGKGYGYVRNLLPLTFLIHTALIFVPLIPALNDPANYLMAEKYILYGVIGSAIMTLLALIFSIIILYRNSKVLGIVLMLGLIGVTGWAVLNNAQFKTDLEVKAGMGSELDSHSNSGPQRIQTMNGILTFTLGDNVDYENWGHATSEAALIFTENNKGSGTLFGGCGAGSSFIEVIEDLDKTIYHTNDRLNVRKETYGNNIYVVYDWAFEPSISYYELYYKNTRVHIVYRPNEPCAVGKNYRPDLELLLKTFNYEGYEKGEPEVAKPAPVIVKTAVVAKEKALPKSNITKQGEGKFESAIYSDLSFTPQIDKTYVSDAQVNYWYDLMWVKGVSVSNYECEDKSASMIKSTDANTRATGIAQVNACLYVMLYMMP